MAGSVVWRVFYCLLQSDDRVISFLLLNLDQAEEDQRISIARRRLENGIVQRTRFVQFVCQDQELNVGFLDGKIVWMTGNERGKFRQGLCGIVARDVKVTKHAVAGGDVGHL